MTVKRWEATVNDYQTRPLSDVKLTTLQIIQPAFSAISQRLLWSNSRQSPIGKSNKNSPLVPIRRRHALAQIGFDQATAHFEQACDQCGFMLGVGFGIGDAVDDDTK